MIVLSMAILLINIEVPAQWHVAHAKGVIVSEDCSINKFIVFYWCRIFSFKIWFPKILRVPF